MDDNWAETAPRARTFGRRRIVPRVCIVDSKRHIRLFLSETMEELGFITCECAQAQELNGVLDAHASDLVVLGLSSGGMDGREIMNLLAARDYSGKVLVLGPDVSTVVKAVQEHGQALGIAMLPQLATPFGNDALRNTVATLLPSESSPPLPIDGAEAIGAGWLEVWYQPKIDIRMLSISGVEALVRVRHPNWGLVTPACFIPDDADPHFRALSEFVIAQVVSDWQYFLTQHGPTHISVNLPFAFLQDRDVIRDLCLRLPDHPAFPGLIIEVSGSDVMQDIGAAIEVARQLRFKNIGLSIDDLGTNWPSLMDIRDFPFAEFKVDREYVAGSADNRLKQSVCRRIVDLANDYGIRTIALGVDTPGDFVAVSDAGFRLAQGHLFSKPVEAAKLVRSVFKQPVRLPH